MPPSGLEIPTVLISIVFEVHQKMRCVRDTISRMPNRVYKRTRSLDVDIESSNLSKNVFIEGHLQLCGADPSRRNTAIVEVNLGSSHEICSFNGERSRRTAFRHDIRRDAE